MARCVVWLDTCARHVYVWPSAPSHHRTIAQAGNTALHWAASNKKEAMMGLLLELGANPNVAGNVRAPRATRDGDCVVAPCSSLFDPVLPVVVLRGAIFVSSSFGVLLGGSHRAVYGCGAHQNGNSPVAWTSYWGMAPLTKVLLERGADPNVPDLVRCHARRCLRLWAAACFVPCLCLVLLLRVRHAHCRARLFLLAALIILRVMLVVYALLCCRTNTLLCIGAYLAPWPVL